MTYHNLKLTAASVAALALSAPALAGDMGSTEKGEHVMHSDAEITYEVKTEVRMDMDDASMTEEDRIGKVLQTKTTTADDAPNKAVLMYDEDAKDKARVKAIDSDHNVKDNAIVVPTLDAESITTVACPIGTTAQTNGTCLITGNFELDRQ